ncbi:MAG: hypothetical protein EXR74_06745 [Bdellovibrionales bacterium]|nr:hypothetical protein [Bdellovibrionales bacterium]
MKKNSFLLLRHLPTWLILSVVALTCFAKASDEGKRCEFETLTKSCSFFDPDGPDKIMFEQGTYLPNLVALEKQATDQIFQSELNRKIASTEKNTTKFLEIKQRLITLLADVSDSSLHPSFKFYLTENFMEFFDFLVGRDGILKTKLEIPWPMNNPIKAKLLSRKEIITTLNIVITAEQVDKLNLIYREMKVLVIYSQTNKLVSSNDDLIKLISSDRQKYVAKLFDFIQARITYLISYGKPEADWTESERQLIRKIKTVKLTALNSIELKNAPPCLSVQPNAFYSSKNHTINLCPTVYSLPDSSLLLIMAHEVAHAIDQCNSQFGTFEISSDKLVKLGEGLKGVLSREISSDSEKKELLIVLMEINKQSNMTAFPFPLIASPASIKYFVDKGVLKRELSGVISAKHPLKNVFDCLDRKQGFRNADRSEIKKLAVAVTLARGQYREPAYDALADQRQIIDAFDSYPGCLNPNKESQMGEAIADWIGAKVLGDYLTDTKLETDQARMGVIGFLAAGVCAERFVSVKESKPTIIKILTTAMVDNGVFSDAHPSSKSRIEKIILRDSKVRKALGCPIERDLACER